MNSEELFRISVEELPLFAILRGLPPEDAVRVGERLVEAGFRILEVPMNSPKPLESIRILSERFGSNVLVGAGTVLDSEAADAVLSNGGRLVVSPNANPDVIRTTVDGGAISVPGCLTPTEAFAALDAGAHGIKIFPAELVPPSGIKALRAVLPIDISVFVVGGVNARNMQAYLDGGATGFGIGSALYKPGKPIEQIDFDARSQIHEFTSLRGTN